MILVGRKCIICLALKVDMAVAYACNAHALCIECLTLQNGALCPLCRAPVLAPSSWIMVSCRSRTRNCSCSHIVSDPRTGIRFCQASCGGHEYCHSHGGDASGVQMPPEDEYAEDYAAGEMDMDEGIGYHDNTLTEHMQEVIIGQAGEINTLTGRVRLLQAREQTDGQARADLLEVNAQLHALAYVPAPVPVPVPAPAPMPAPAPVPAPAANTQDARAMVATRELEVLRLELQVQHVRRQAIVQSGITDNMRTMTAGAHDMVTAARMASNDIMMQADAENGLSMLPPRQARRWISNDAHSGISDAVYFRSF